MAVSQPATTPSNGTAGDLAHQCREHVAVADMNDVTLCHAKRDQEQHDAGAVVEQALADDSGTHARRQSDLAAARFSTTTASVGARIAPSTKHQMRGIAAPIRPNDSHMP